MKNKLILLFVLIFGIVIILVVGLRFFEPTLSPDKSNTNTVYQSQTNEKGAVVVEVLPTKLSSKENAEFTLEFTTHSVDLGYDIKAIALLTDDKDNTYKALSWTGGKGGHHISGTLTFAKLSQEASAVTLTIPGIDNFDRVFEWKLN